MDITFIIMGFLLVLWLVGFAFLIFIGTGLFRIDDDATEEEKHEFLSKYALGLACSGAVLCVMIVIIGEIDNHGLLYM